jgi:type I restriction enzyme S subunit
VTKLPAGWASAPVAHLVAQNGILTDGDWVESKDQDPAGVVRLLQLADVGDGVFLDKSNRFITNEKFAQLRCTEVVQDDVLVARMPAPLGRACLAPKLNHRCITVVDVAIVRPGPSSVEPKWLMHFVNAPSVRQLIQQQSSGTTRRRISRSRLAQLELPVPPLAEQKRIADQLDALFKRLEACSEHLDRVPTILKRFRQSVLADATSGELTRGWREERGLTKNWIESRIEQIASVGTGSTPLRANSAFYSDAGTPWITSAMTGLPFVTRADEYVTDAAIAAHRLKRYRAGTLLVAMYGEGRTRGQVTELRIEATINQACAAISVDERKAVTAFVRLALESNYLQMRELAEGGNQPNLNLSKIKGFPLSLPPMDEQREIVRRVHAVFALVGRIDDRVRAVKAQAELLSGAILGRAFRGELVATEAQLAAEEGRDYETASVLLERIQESRKRQTSATGARGGENVASPDNHLPAVTRRPLDQVLREQGKPLSPERLFDLAGFDEDSVDGFYEQLRKAVEEGKVRENRPNEKDVTLEAIAG